MPNKYYGNKKKSRQIGTISTRQQENRIHISFVVVAAVVVVVAVVVVRKLQCISRLIGSNIYFNIQHLKTGKKCALTHLLSESFVCFFLVSLCLSVILFIISQPLSVARGCLFICKTFFMYYVQIYMAFAKCFYAIKSASFQICCVKSSEQIAYAKHV